MALTNNTELKAAIADWINRDDLTTQIVEFISLTESRIASDLQTNDLHTTTTLTVDSANESLPTNFKGIVRINLNGDYPALDYIPPDSFHSRYASKISGRPLAFTIEGNEIYFAPTPDDTYTATYTYLAKPDIATDTTNRLLTINPDVYLFGALCEAADFIGDQESYAKYEMRYRQAIDSMNDIDQYKGALAFQLDGVV